MRPQECGHHIDCEYLSIGGLAIRSDRFEFNALRCAVEDLDSEEAVQRDYQWENKGPLTENDPAKAKNRLRRQTHINDYVERDFVEVCVDYAQSGVGGYDSWGSRRTVTDASGATVTIHSALRFPRQGDGRAEVVGI